MLKAIKLGQQLTKTEMKGITGGIGCFSLKKDGTVDYFSGDSALDRAKAAGVRYCCDSCKTASWMQSLYADGSVTVTPIK